MYYYDIIHVGKVNEVAGKVTLEHDNYYSQEHLEQLISKFKKEYYTNKVGKRHKYEAFDHTLLKLYELGFKRKTVIYF